MFHGVILFSMLAAVVEARFNQAQGSEAIQKINELSDLGLPGDAANLGAECSQTLLLATNPCDKLRLADKIVAVLGDNERSIAAARSLVAAEQDFDPLVVGGPSLCGDVALPETPSLRGIVPQVDPTIAGQEVANENAALSVQTPFDAEGKSVADVAITQGFFNFQVVRADGTLVSASPLSDGSPEATAMQGDPNDPITTTPISGATLVRRKKKSKSGAPSLKNLKPFFPTSPLSDDSPEATAKQGNPNDPITTTPISGATLVKRKRKSRSGAPILRNSQPFFPTSSETAVGKGVGAVDDPITGTFEGFVSSTIKDADFGTCVPTMKFEAGLNGRKETEFTFQAIDPKINAGQVEDLDPKVITKRISGQVTSICGANQAAKDATAAALTKVAGLGTKDSSTADAWNSALGFAGTDTNPDKAPKAGLIGHA